MEEIFDYAISHTEKETKNYWKSFGIERVPYKSFSEEEGKKQAKLSQLLATIVTTLDFEIVLQDLEVSVTEDELRRIKGELKITSLKRQGSLSF